MSVLRTVITILSTVLLVVFTHHDAEPSDSDSSDEKVGTGGNLGGEGKTSNTKDGTSPSTIEDDGSQEQPWDPVTRGVNSMLGVIIIFLIANLLSRVLHGGLDEVSLLLTCLLFFLKGEEINNWIKRNLDSLLRIELFVVIQFFMFLLIVYLGWIQPSDSNRIVAQNSTPTTTLTHTPTVIPTETPTPTATPGPSEMFQATDGEWIMNEAVTMRQLTEFLPADLNDSSAPYFDDTHWTDAGIDWRDDELILTPDDFGDLRRSEAVATSYYLAVAYCHWHLTQMGYAPDHESVILDANRWDSLRRDSAAEFEVEEGVPEWTSTEAQDSGLRSYEVWIASDNGNTNAERSQMEARGIPGAVFRCVHHP